MKKRTLRPGMKIQVTDTRSIWLGAQGPIVATVGYGKDMRVVTDLGDTNYTCFDPDQVERVAG